MSTAPGNLCPCLPFSVFWQSSHKITRKQHTILTNRVIQFLEPSETSKLLRKRNRIAPGWSPRVGFLVYRARQPLLLPTFFGVLAVESQDHENTAYNTYRHGDIVFRAIRHKEKNTEINTDFSTGQSPSLFSGCRHFTFGFRDTYSEFLRIKRAE